MSAVKDDAFDLFEGQDAEMGEYDASDPLSHGLFVQSARGVIRLVDSLGYIYHKDRHCPDNNKTYWRCQRRNLNCKCRAVTLGNFIVGINGQHFHGCEFSDA
ncbi:Hypothetical predicted protein [Cloeon dipterum]|uniref:FLYWCH-type domain-containing protein n=1 Tax=Cloeon dipterum TaxID=197152 RepID=A0A8S1CXC0_9INSE|nr:Hypothetical predicted protein [Cloeon dipterum]